MVRDRPTEPTFDEQALAAALEKVVGHMDDRIAAADFQLRVSLILSVVVMVGSAFAVASQNVSWTVIIVVGAMPLLSLLESFIAKHILSDVIDESLLIIRQSGFGLTWQKAPIGSGRRRFLKVALPFGSTLEDDD